MKRHSLGRDEKVDLAWLKCGKDSLWFARHSLLNTLIQFWQSELTSGQDSIKLSSHLILLTSASMQSISIQMLTICGISELPDQRERSVTHVLSILDPDHPDPEAFGAYDPHRR